MRRRSPDCRTVPSSTAETPSSAPIARMSCGSLEGERGCARGDAQAVDLGERVDQLVADAVAQVFVLRVGAAIYEREYRDGARSADERRYGPGSRLFQGHRQEIGRA